MVDIDYLKEKVVEFRDERNWISYHTPKDLSISVAIEAAELLELFQWKDKDYDETRLEEEMADVLIYLLSLSDVTDIDLEKAVLKKIEKNREKYPV